jgi:hypothetical protein
MNSAFGTPLSVAKVANVAVVLAGTLLVRVVCADPDGIGLNCLYVGVPKAELVSVDSFM